ncbi:MAG TPA: sulfite exporter TauE/SafE family protein [Draconibacterium sp.]|nr:sulfite exporter TauE/SafE family protein [Draconibacterium sp.]
MNELHILLVSALSLGFIHTLLGPDHYLPFIVLSKARGWSQSKTLWITFISGIGHVGGSVILGVTGVALGISVNKLKLIETTRGSIVGWMLILFGIIYTMYGIYKYFKHGGHFHLPHFMMPKRVRQFHHLPTEESGLPKEDNTKLTPWILFLIFVFGPCEVLIPLLIYPAAEHNTFGIAAVSTLFGIATIVTMLAMVLLGYKGISTLRFKKGEKYWNLIAGLIILIAGIGMTFMGW